MKFSVVTIVYNDVAHIEATILSVLSQSHPDTEYIVIDGASTDGTSDIIRKYSARITTCIREKDTGIYNAMNKGLEKATGDYVIFMNSGDRFSSDSVLSDINDCIGPATPAVVYGTYRESVNGIPGTIIPCRKPSMIWYGPVASHQSTFYNVDFLRNNHLRYDESYKIGADYKLTLQAITAAGKNLLKTDICVSDFDLSGLSNTSQNQGLEDANRARREVLRWGHVRCFGMKIILLGARYCKRYATPIYNCLRK